MLVSAPKTPENEENGAEGLGIGALAVIADSGLHNPRDAWDPRGLRNQVLAVVSP